MNHIDVAGILIIVGSFFLSPQVGGVVPAKWAGIAASIGGVLVAVGTYIKNERNATTAATVANNTIAIQATARAVVPPPIAGQRSQVPIP